MNHTLWSLSDYFFAFIFRVGNSLIFLNVEKKKLQALSASEELPRWAEQRERRERSAHCSQPDRQNQHLTRWNCSQHRHTSVFYYDYYFKKLFSFQIKYNLAVAKATFFSFLGTVEKN